LAIRFCEPLNEERRILPLRLDARLAQFLYINWPAGGTPQGIAQSTMHYE
jgi:hypothetical protein